MEIRKFSSNTVLSRERGLSQERGPCAKASIKKKEREKKPWGRGESEFAFGGEPDLAGNASESTTCLPD